MSYTKTVSPLYVPRRRTSKGLLKKVISKSETGASAHSSFMSANIQDVSNFLAKYLTGKENVLVRPQAKGGFSTCKETYARKTYDIINTPEWQRYNLNLPSFDKYRIFRSGIWHETNHIAYSPEPVYKFGSNKTEKFMINILEDRRTEDIGTQKWKGYIPERIYTQAYYYAVRPDVSSLYKSTLPPDSQENKQARIEAFLQRMLIGKVKGSLPKDQMETVERVATFAEQRLKPLTKETASEATITTNLEALTLEVIRELDVAPSKDAKGESSDEKGLTLPDWNEGRNPNVLPGGGQKAVNKKMQEFFEEKNKELGKDKDKGEDEGKGKSEGKGEETKTDQFGFSSDDVAKATEGSSDAKAEYAKVVSAGASQIDPALVHWQTPTVYGPTSPYRDTTFMNRMKTELAKWRKGYEEITGTSGSRFKVKQWIRKPKEPFITRLKRSVKGNKILVLADFSGSTLSFMDEYKRAIVSGLETLDGVGCKVGLFAFGDQFFQVKRFEEPRWTSAHASKLAGLGPLGNTYTGTAYEKLGDYVQRHRPDVFVTLTDGEPNFGERENTERQVAKLKRQTRMVAFGITDPRSHAAMESQLKKYGYTKSFAVTDVNEIPKKLVKTMIGE